MNYKTIIALLFSLAIATQSINAQTSRKDTLTLIGGYVRSASNGGGRLLFTNSKKDTLSARTTSMESYLNGINNENLWDSAIDCPPCGIYKALLYKRFQVTYQQDSTINTEADSDTPVYMPIIKINKLVLIKPQ